MGVYLLNKEEISFPNPTLAEPDGLLAVGGDLSVERLLLAYSHGIFPWYNPEEEILWWCPRERFVIFPDETNEYQSTTENPWTYFWVTLTGDFAKSIINEHIKAIKQANFGNNIYNVDFYQFATVTIA